MRKETTAGRKNEDEGEQDGKTRQKVEMTNQAGGGEGGSGKGG